jgi:hypothetical protein
MIVWLLACVGCESMYSMPSEREKQRNYVLPSC